MDCKITLIPGDGIGPEIVREAVKVLDAVGKKYEHHFTYERFVRNWNCLPIFVLHIYTMN